MERSARGDCAAGVSGSWIFCKKANVTPEIAEKNPDAGDVWLWVALDADTKLVLSHPVGSRTPLSAYQFMEDVASRIQFVDPSRPFAEQHRVQVTTDGLVWYLDAVDHAFGANLDYAMQQKEFGGHAVDKSAAARYSSSRITSVTTEVIKGNPDPKHISTSFVERQNWNRSNESAPLHAVVEWLQPKAGEPRGSGVIAVFRLQFHPHSPYAENESSNGRIRDEQAVGSVGFGGAARRSRIQKSGLASHDSRRTSRSGFQGCWCVCTKR